MYTSLVLRQYKVEKTTGISLMVHIYTNTWANNNNKKNSFLLIHYDNSWDSRALHIFQSLPESRKTVFKWLLSEARMSSLKKYLLDWLFSKKHC